MYARKNHHVKTEEKIYIYWVQKILRNSISKAKTVNERVGVTGQNLLLLFLDSLHVRHVVISNN